MKKILLLASALALTINGSAYATDITWADKSSGDTVTSADMNEIKTAVNSKADKENISFLAGSLDDLKIKGASVTAGSFVTSQFYEITSVGTTDFTAIGASANTVGVSFTATGAGSGTGTAKPIYTVLDDSVGYGDTDDNTVGWSIEQIGDYVAANGGGSGGYVTTPTYSDESCTTGQYSVDASYFYFCEATDTWDRFAVTWASWSNPSPTIPTLSSATIATDGTSITLVGSESLSIGAGGNGGFDLDCTTAGDNVTMTYSSGAPGTDLVYTLGSTIYTGDTCTLDYVQPTDGVEATTGGGDLASIVDGTVTNGSTATAGVGTTNYPDYQLVTDTSAATGFSDANTNYYAGIINSSADDYLFWKMDAYLRRNGDLTGKTVSVEKWSVDANGDLTGSADVITTFDANDISTSLGYHTITLGQTVELGTDTAVVLTLNEATGLDDIDWGTVAGKTNAAGFYWSLFDNTGDSDGVGTTVGGIRLYPVIDDFGAFSTDTSYDTNTDSRAITSSGDTKGQSFEVATSGDMRGIGVYIQADASDGVAKVTLTLGTDPDLSNASNILQTVDVWVGALNWYYFFFDALETVTSSTTYYYGLTVADGSSSVSIRLDDTSPTYADGMYYYGSSKNMTSSASSIDMMFKILMMD